MTAPSHEAPWRARPSDVAAIEALQRAAYARNRVLLGVEPMPLQVDYRDIVAKMEVWLFGPSDGLHGVVEEGVIAEALAGNGSLESKCRKLIEAAKAAGGPDNITTVLLRAK